jgi:hypothetical protein
MSEFLRFGKISFLNKISKDGIHSLQSGKQKKATHLAKKKIYSKISKEGIILQNSVKLKNISTHLAKTNFTVKSPKKVSFSHLQ